MRLSISILVLAAILSAVYTSAASNGNGNDYLKVQSAVQAGQAAAAMAGGDFSKGAMLNAQAMANANLARASEKSKEEAVKFKSTFSTKGTCTKECGGPPNMCHQLSAEYDKQWKCYRPNHYPSKELCEAKCDITAENRKSCKHYTSTGNYVCSSPGIMHHIKKAAKGLFTGTKNVMKKVGHKVQSWLK
jgi:hypothetical protein